MRVGVRTKKACEIAVVDPARFNEMVHAGHYPCAPQTRPGSARIFGLDETVALKIFGNLLSMSVAPERAGQIACAAYRMFEGQLNVERLVYSCDRFGDWSLKEEGPFPQLLTFRAFSLVLDISELREQVGDALEWEEKFGKGDGDA